MRAFLYEVRFPYWLAMAGLLALCFCMNRVWRDLHKLQKAPTDRFGFFNYGRAFRLHKKLQPDSNVRYLLPGSIATIASGVCWLVYWY